MSRSRRGWGSLQRQYAAVTAVFAVLVLAIIFVFGHLISGSLSRRYLEEVFVSGREEAKKIADELGEEAITDLQVMSRRREQLVRTLAGLPQRKILESIEVTDHEGKVVFTSNFQSTEALPEDAASHIELSGPLSDQEVHETEKTWDISVPLGEVGEVVVSVSKARLAERVLRIRRELLQQTVTTAVLTLLTLIIAFLFVWGLIQRTRKLEAARHDAEELAALGSLAANLAHEIRNPLNSINLNLELLEEDLADGGSAGEASLQTTRQEVARLARLVSDFLTFARPTPPTMTPVRVVALAQEVVEFVRAEARAMGTHLRLAPDLPEVEVSGDPGQLRQVLLNLLLNGVQAVAGLEPERRVVELAATARGEEVVLRVRDRGEGVPEEELENVRRAFYTRRRGGTGLGLAIAERIAMSHGGRLELRNRAPYGFEALVVLPICVRDVKIGEAPGEPDPRGELRWAGSR